MRTYKVVYSTGDGRERGEYLAAENLTEILKRAASELPDLDEIIEIIPMPKTAS